jgi:hypothetical protein
MVSQSPAQWADDAWQVFCEYLQTERNLLECAQGVAGFLQENSALDDYQRDQFYHRLLRKQYPALQALQLAGELAARIDTTGQSSLKQGKAPTVPIGR